MPNFAALEQRLNRVATTHLANATAVWQPGGWPVAAPVHGLRVVFDREAAPGLEGMVSDFNPVVSVFEASMRGAKRGDTLDVTLDATDATTRYEVARASADGTGLLVLSLMAEGSL